MKLLIIRKTMIVGVLLSASTFFVYAAPPRVRVNNDTGRPLSVALYKKDAAAGAEQEWHKESPTITIPAGKQGMITTPLIKKHEKLALFSAPTASRFQAAHLTQEQADRFIKRELAQKEDLFLHLRHDYQGIGFYTSADARLLKNKKRSSEKHPHSNRIAYVRPVDAQHPTLSPQELVYRSQRMPKVRRALQQFLPELKLKADDKLPTIAVITSGGGYRSMIGTLGFYSGLAHLGLLDAAMYLSSLSGSTWALTALCVHMMDQKDKKLSVASIDALSTKLFAQLGLNLTTFSPAHRSLERKLLIKSLTTQAKEGRPIGLVDLYGAYLSNRLFNDRPDRGHTLTISSFERLLEDGSFPFPIFTALDAYSVGEEVTESRWLEVNPYEVGAPWLGCYVPTYAYGRLFRFGESLNFAPELSIDHFLGMFGSAFAAHMHQLISVTKKGKGEELSDFIRRLLRGGFGAFRLTATQALNFSHDMPASRYKDRRMLNFADAGVTPGFNIPYVPVSGQIPARRADIMIIFDATSYGGLFEQWGQMERMKKYAKAQGYALPPIPLEQLKEKKSIQLFSGAATEPVVIYVPLVALEKEIERPYLNYAHGNKGAVTPDGKKAWQLYEQNKLYNFDLPNCIRGGYCDTMNFIYKKEQASQLSDFVKFVLINEEGKKRIKDGVRKWFELQRGS